MEQQLFLPEGQFLQSGVGLAHVALFASWETALISARHEMRIPNGALAALELDVRSHAMWIWSDAWNNDDIASGGLDTLVSLGRGLVADVVKARTNLLTYRVTPHNLLIWLVSPAGKVWSVSEPLDADELTRMLNDFNEELCLADADTTCLTRGGWAGKATHVLSARLLPQQLSPHLDPNRDLVIVPSGRLWNLPFAALQRSDMPIPLGAMFPIRYDNMPAGIRGSRVLQLGGQSLVVGPAPASAVTIFGSVRVFGPLTYAKSEADSVANLIGTPVLTNFAANRDTLLARMANARIIHFATHAMSFSGLEALSSFILLPQEADGNRILTANDVANGPFLNNADLVVLSACQTGLGEVTRTEGVLGMPVAFLSHGAAAVVYSLWAIDDSSSAALIENFYVNLLSGSSKAQALQSAQQAIRMNRTQHQYSKPYYWAAFSLMDGG